MIRRAAVFAVAFVVALTTAVAGASTKSSIAIRKLDTSNWPNVTVTVSTKGVNPEDLRLEENGLPVTDLEVRSLREVGVHVDVVLVIDTSGSMKGKPFASAVRAATNFVNAVPDEVRIGLVSFADAPVALVGLTTDRSEVLRALEDLRPKGRTALYDAVDLAARLFTEESQRNIVLLSDGADTSSGVSLSSTKSAVEEAHATVFSVGLKSGKFDARALRDMSVSSGGRYAPVATADLSTVYEGLATELGNQIIMTYTSVSRPDSEAAIEVFSPEGADRVLTLTPSNEKNDNPRNNTQPDEPDAPGSAIFSGQFGLPLVLLVTFGCVLGLTTLVFGSHLQSRRTRSLARRMGATPAGSAEIPTDSATGPVGWIPDSVVQMASAVATRGGLGTRLDDKLEQAGISMSAAEFIAASVLAGGGGAVLGFVLAQGPLFAALTAFVGGAVPYLVLMISLRRRLRKLQSQLADILMILASSLRAGHSFMQALNSVAQEISGPGGQEFGRVVAEIRLGRSPEDSLNDLARRIDSDDLKWAVLAVNIQRDVGGNLAEVLDTIAETMRERDSMRRQVDVLSAEGRMSIGILSSLPFFVGAYMTIVNPKYLGLLMSTGIGRVMLVTGSCLLAVGIFWMRRVVKINV